VARMGKERKRIRPDRNRGGEELMSDEEDLI
jgi:hypothetical protein